MAKNRNKKHTRSSRFGGDVIGFYAKQKKVEKETVIYWADADDIHNVAKEIFGSTFYISFDPKDLV